MRVHAVPRRRGALGPNADGLPAGCRALAALAGEVLGVPVREVPITDAGSDTVHGIANRETLLRNRSAQLAALEAPEGPVFTIGGDCGVELVPVALARYRHGERLGVAWFDAHADLNTAASSPSGAYHGMVLRSLLGEGDPEFAADPAVLPGRAVLCGARVFDPAERAAVHAGLAGHVQSADDPRQVAAALRASGAERIYLHLDLDVLDPAEFGHLNYPEPGGLSIAQLAAGIGGLAGFEVVDAGITECVGAEPADLRPLVPVLEAIGALLRR
ncbi:arginase family protein [Amycolatopsis cihanbeyliensis]|uniref:Arginase n=1 Tax=Amycolatopsis cihanbeyliensis TaxID=1128664 RepID=A0A542DH70_AMYCI|nr:arginase family protein [Amycolatopsis cihanbeyliensis]TQJ02376.1 arginase [Amycolatopsis cihanbeyliensis]